jgi:hypothetical protein
MKYSTNEWKETLKVISRIDLKEHWSDERKIRKAMSQLRKEGIVFLPIEPFVYVDIAKNKGERVENAKRKYVNAEWRKAITHINNTCRPLSAYINEEMKKEMMGVLV